MAFMSEALAGAPPLPQPVDSEDTTVVVRPAESLHSKKTQDMDMPYGWSPDQVQSRFASNHLTALVILISTY